MFYCHILNISWKNVIKILLTYKINFTWICYLDIKIKKNGTWNLKKLVFWLVVNGLMLEGFKIYQFFFFLEITEKAANRYHHLLWVTIERRFDVDKTKCYLV